MSSQNSLTIFPYYPFKLDWGINEINFQNNSEFSSLLFHLHKLNNKEILLDDEENFVQFYTAKNLDTSSLKNLEIIGDLNSFSINTTQNLKKVFKKISQDSLLEFNDQIESLNNQINGLIFDTTSRFDGQLSYDTYANFENLLKLKLLKFNEYGWTNFYDKILDVINFFNEFTDKHLLITYNLHNLLDYKQRNELNQYLNSAEISLVSFESIKFDLNTGKINHRIFNIDEDHIRFDY